MFGYVIPDKPNMLIKDFADYRTHYCGLCKTISKEYGQLPRFATNYDSTFLSIFLHSVNGVTPDLDNKACALNPLKKRLYVAFNPIMRDVADATVLLGYYKAVDDVLDEGGFKGRAARRVLKRAKRKAAKRQPQIDLLILDSYAKLRELEAANCQNVDEVADCFSKMLEDVAKILLREKFVREQGLLMYNVGKWIYLADAIDDLQKDFEAKRYNPIIASLGEFLDKNSYLTEHKEDLSFLLMTAYNAVVDNYNLLEIKNSEGALSNIIYLGLKGQTSKLLEGKELCKTIRL